MIPSSFDYRAPRSLEEAIGLLGKYGDEAKILAGGHSLLPLMKLRLAVPEIVVDLGKIPALQYIREDGNEIAIGAMTTYVAIEDSAVVRTGVPILWQTAGMVGDAQVRNRGTIGGAAAHADPAGDIPTVLVALRATMVARGPSGERTIGAEEFFQDVFTSALQPDEILTEIRVGRPRGAGDYQKFRRRMVDWAIVGVAAHAVRNNGSIESASIVLTNVGSRPIRAIAVEHALEGGPASADVIRRASDLAGDDIDPSPELHASADYKKHLARVLTRRALEKVLA
ncbi:MAG: FAD binding domain-containing protein [Chloroflexota bacterium]